MQDEPAPPEILDAVTSFLRQDVLPRLEGAVAFQLRVAINAIDLVSRALAAPAAETASEHQTLRELLGRDGSIAGLTEALAEGIAAGRIGLHTPGLEAFLWEVTEAKMAVDQPHYAGLLRARSLRAAAAKQEV